MSIKGCVIFDKHSPGMKFLRRLFLFVLVLFLVLYFVVPRFFEGKLNEILKEQVNRNIHATLDFEDVSLSLFKGFPDAHVTVLRPVLINKFPFQGDTLFSARQLSLEMSLGELFKGRSEPIGVSSLELDSALLRIKVDRLGRANYDLERPGGAPSQESGTGESGGIRLDLKRYEIRDGMLTYDDYKSRMHLEINEMNHTGFGDLSLETSELQTETEANVSFEYDSISYLKDNRVALSAGFGIDLSMDKYVFLKNRALVNNLPLVFDGYVQLLEGGQDIDLRFQTPSSDFKNFLAVIPQRYARDIETVETTGEFSVNGNLKGMVTDNRIPTFDIRINADKAAFRYPELDKSVQDVNIDARFYNTTGRLEDTYIDLRNLAFDLDGDKFRSTARIEHVTGNTRVNAEIKGKLNLNNLSRAYPMPSDYDLRGVLLADVSTDFDMESVKAGEYEKTKTRGTLDIRDFKYNSDELRNPIEINLAAVGFDPNSVTLKNFDARIGKTDLNATGKIQNLLGFLFNKENVRGDFTLDSRQFVVNDFIVDEEVQVKTGNKDASQGEYTVERIRIPSFLDCTVKATAEQVQYDNMLLRKVSGALRIKDQTATIDNLKAELFGGNIALNGNVSTADAIPSFELKLDAVSLDISEAFTSLNLFKALSPIGGALKGGLSSSMEFSGLLKDNLTLEMGTVEGRASSTLDQARIDSQGTPLLLALDREFSQISFDDWSLDKTQVALDFEDGRVQVKPFIVMLRDIPVRISGGHGFDRSLDYDLNFEIPAKYLGKSVTDLIVQLNDPEMLELKIPVKADLQGNYTNPKLTTDLNFVVENLTRRLIERQQERLLNQGKDRAEDLLRGLLDRQDSTVTDSARASQNSERAVNAAGNLLNNILKGKSKDSTRQR